MNILVIGEKSSFHECQQKFGSEHSYTLARAHGEAQHQLKENQLVFDFCIENDATNLEIYRETTASVFLNTCNVTLAKLLASAGRPISNAIYGFCGMPTFLNRDIIEVSMPTGGSEPELRKICSALGTEYILVDDSVGLVTPRVICMIINEAYYTVLQGTATREDVDSAMVLGTNYPQGPFAWSERIGIKHVYKLLDAMYGDTHDERYKICPALKKEYLRN